MDLYVDYHTETVRKADSIATQRGTPLQDAPEWMRLGGLTAANWQVLTEYLAVLTPLKLATKRLEGCGKAGKYSAIHEVPPIYKYLLTEYEQLATTYKAVNYNKHNAPKDHLAINLQAAVNKLNKYYKKLDESPYYFIAKLLHPCYKTYCEVHSLAQLASGFTEGQQIVLTRVLADPSIGLAGSRIEHAFRLTWDADSRKLAKSQHCLVRTIRNKRVLVCSEL